MVRKRPLNLKLLWIWIPIFVVLLMVSISVSVTFGAANIDWLTVWKIIISKIPFIGDFVTPDWSGTTETIVWELRLPRVILAVLVGASLALAGAIYQGVLRNPLADPYILGVSSGASLGAALVILFGWNIMLLGQFTLPAVAFIFGFVTLMVVYLMARVQNKIRLETIILSGVVVQAFIGACLSLILALANEQMRTILFWMMGSLSSTTWTHSMIIFPIVTIIAFISLFFMKELNMLGLGEEAAHHSGVSVQKTRFFLLLIASIITGAAVSVSGAIGFVGLVVPHIIRLLFGSDYRVIIPLSFIGGAIFLVGADAITRILFAPRELPLGIITAFLGAPFFAYLLRKAKREYF